jgi:Uma2 family endonuclease
MSSAPSIRISPQEYLKRERQAEFKSEYLRGEVFAMAGASYEHTRITDNLVIQVGRQLNGGPCEVLASDMRVKVDKTGLYTYPDLAIACEKLQFEDATVDTLLNPQIIIEVLSDSTEKYDRGDKFAHYRQIPSLREYVLVAQDRPLVERFVRQDDGSWSPTAMDNLADTFAFETISVKIPLRQIYARVEFPESPKR